MLEDQETNSFGFQSALTQVSVTSDRKASLIAQDIVNIINSYSYEQHERALQDLSNYFIKYGPIFRAESSRLFFSKLAKFITNSDNENIRNISFHCLCWLGYTVYKDYPIDFLAQNDVFGKIHSLLTSNNDNQINEGLGLMTGLLINPEIVQKYIDDNIFNYFQTNQYSINTLWPIFIYKFLTKINLQLFSDFNFIIQYLYPYLQSPYTPNRFYTLNSLILLHRNEYTFDLTPIHSNFMNLLSDDDIDVVESTLYFVNTIESVDADLFNKLIDIQNKSEYVSKASVRYLMNNADNLDESQFQNIYQNILYGADNFSNEYTILIIPYLVTIVRELSVCDTGAFEIFAKYLDDSASCANCIAGMYQIIQLAQSQGSLGDFMETLSSCEDAIEDLMQSDDEVISEIASNLMNILHS